MWLDTVMRLPAWPIGDSTLLVDEPLVGERLDVALVPLFGSQRSVKESVQNGNLFINGAAPWGSPRLQLGDVISVFPWGTRPGFRAEANPMPILYEDDWLLVIEKPPGIPMYPGPGWPCRTVANAVRALGNVSGFKGDIRAGILGRLDREVSGVIMVAREEEVHRAMVTSYVNREVKRRYLALVIGHAEAGSSDASLQRRRKNRSGYRAVPPGTENSITALTHWRPLVHTEHTTFLEVSPFTGRRHQIRAHLAAMGYPILGDMHYGGELGRLRQRGGFDGNLPPLKRIALHLETIEIMHPKTQTMMRFHAPWPKDLPPFEDPGPK
jgi:23S rRNA pseudouridine1911/1915/1917 synthase